MMWDGINSWTTSQSFKNYLIFKSVFWWASATRFRLRFKNTRQTITVKMRKLDGIFSSCNTPLAEVISNSDGWAHFWSLINCLSCLQFLFLSFLVTLHLLLCASDVKPSSLSTHPSQFYLRIRGVKCDVEVSWQAAECCSGGVFGVSG